MNTTKITLAQLHAHAGNDLAATTALIDTTLTQQWPTYQDVSQHLISAGGKRLRPLLTLLSANALGYQGQGHITLAAIVELLHTATLLHDDVVDESTLRRHQKTANAVWGNQTSVLVGDFLYTLAFRMLLELQHFPLMQAITEATSTIVTGELMQLHLAHQLTMTEADYFVVIEKKTARLFSVAAEIGARIATDYPAHIEALITFGHHLGLAYQLIDDALDYTSDGDTLGKRIGDDLAEGKVTLPLIYALQQAPQTRSTLENALNTQNTKQLNQVLTIIADTHAIAYVKQQAHSQITLAIHALSTLAPAQRLPLTELAEFVVQREK